MTTDLYKLICERKGWTDDFIKAINEPTHQPLHDIDKMADILHQIKLQQKLLVILPDFDMDGIASGTLGFAGFAELGFNVALYRNDYVRGHGFDAREIDEIIEEFPDVSAIITCDVGIDSHAGINHAKEKGLTVLITDHHKEIPRVGVSSNADCVVNPNKIDDTYPNKGICGAHVLYQVLETYATKYDQAKTDAISLLKLFAGIGTVSDVMPLQFENRQLVSDSISVLRLLYLQPTEDEPDVDVMDTTLLQLLAAGDHSPVFVSAFVGAATVIKLLQLEGNLRNIDDINEGFYGFYLAPAFNSIRRIDGDIDDAFNVFFAKNRDEAMARIIELNNRRKELVEIYYEELLNSDQPLAPHVYLTTAKAGMLGLLANKLMHSSGMPTLVINHNSDGTFSGSGRAPGWYNFNSKLNAEGFVAAGHEQAFGVRISNDEALARCVEFLNTDVHNTLSALILSGALDEADRPDLRLGAFPDCDAHYTDTEELIHVTERIQAMGPFGHEFTYPEIELVVDLDFIRLDTLPLPRKNVPAAEQVEPKHLRLTLETGLKCLWWNHADSIFDLNDLKEDITPDSSIVRLRGKLETNVYMGNTSLNFIIERISPL